MSGHSKWSTIKHKKAKTDAQRGKMFTKVVREITIAAKLGGADPELNPRLRLALQKAKEANMPNDNIKRAVEKGAGGSDGNELEEIVFEAYGPNGVALMIPTLTDNKFRTVPNLKNILNRAGGSMASKGAVSYMFKSKGLIIFEPGHSEDTIMEVAMVTTVEDVLTNNDGSVEVVTEPDFLDTVRQAFDLANLSYTSAELTMIPDVTIPLDLAAAEQILKLIDKLEDDDDVQNVFGNFDISDEVMASLA